MGKLKPTEERGDKFPLSQSQLDCLRQFETGVTVTQIAKNLKISERTVARDLRIAANKLRRLGQEDIVSKIYEATEGLLPKIPRSGSSHRRKRTGDRMSKLHVAIREKIEAVSQKIESASEAVPMAGKRFAPQMPRVHDRIQELAEGNLNPLKLIPHSKPQSEHDPRWDELEKFAIESKGVGVAKRGQELFPELHAQPVDFAPKLPVAAPEIYQGLRGPETPPDFVKRVYAEWLGQGLTRSHIRKLDPILSTAIDNWSRKPENEWPSDVDLPTAKERNDRWAERAATAGRAAALGPDASITDYHRLNAVLSRRKTGEKTKP